MRGRIMLMVSTSLLTACGGSGGGGVASTPVVSSAAPTPPTAAAAPANVVPSVNYDTSEYRRSNGAAQAQALVAYGVGATGKEIVVGIIDSGVAVSNPEFAGRISPFSRDFAGIRSLGDDGGHGTAVAQILLGARNDSGTHGIAFDATLLALRTDTPGSCTSGASDGGGCNHADAAMAAALDGAVAAKARVVNISLGGSPANNALRAAIARATAAGTIIVIAAGNDGVKNPNTAVDPDMLAQIATDPIARGLVIIAGATDTGGALADFSNKAGIAAANYMTALGVKVRSTDQNGTALLYSGTSFSTPVIAGAAALLAQAFPNLTAAQIVALLYRTATDLGAAGVDATYGNGELNLARAFAPQGATSLAGVGVSVSLTGNATLGATMGDAAKGGMAATIRDEYGRDFAVDLGGTIARTAPAAMLGQALAIGTRSLTGGAGRASIALAVADGGTQHLLLDHRDASRARVLAGAVAIALGKATTLGIGVGRESAGLTSAASSEHPPAFLIGDRGLDHAPLAAFAMRHRLGKLGVTVAVESGDVRLWQAGETGPRSDRWRHYGYAQSAVAIDVARGPWTLGARLTRLRERETVLGGRFDAAFGGGGATTWFADAELAVAPGSEWYLAATVRHGWTSADTNALRGASHMTSRALRATLTKSGVFGGDSLALRYAEPLRVTGGGLALTLPGMTPQQLTLAPQGHERNWELAYARPFGGGWVTLNAYRRLQPGHWAAAPTDTGAGLRWSRAF